jgi:hypothetical protein
MWPPSAQAALTVAEAAGQALDWPHFIAIVHRHRIVGLAYHALNHTTAAVPPAVLAALRRDAMTQAKAGLLLAAETIAIDRMMRNGGIDAVILKGAPLGRLAYGDLGIRHSRDIDVLVTPQTLPAAFALLEQAGYQPCGASVDLNDARMALTMRHCYHLEYLHPDGGALVELHWRLAANPHRVAPIPPPARWTTVSLSGAIGVRSFAGADLDAYLFAHGAQHCWFRLKWLADIGALLAGRSNAEIEQMVATVTQMGLRRPLAQGLLLAARLLKTPLPPGLDAELSKDRRSRWLVDLAIAAMTAGDAIGDPHDLPFGETRINLSQYLLQAGSRYWLATAAQNFACGEDWLTVPLPRRLIWLYPFLRLPLWVARQARRCGRLVASARRS